MLTASPPRPTIGESGPLRRPAGPRPRRLRWWVEVGMLGAAYAAYAWVRSARGSRLDQGDYRRALANAQRILGLEQRSGVAVERSLQRLFLHAPGLVRFMDSFWSVAYLLVTAGALLWLLALHRDRYVTMRRALFVTTVIGLVVFATVPVLPPRLLPSQYGFIDTWQAVGGLASHRAPQLERISDPYAAMPSLHVAWAVWSAAAVLPILRNRLVRLMAVAYPVATGVVVLVTGNHWLLDVVAGALAAAVGLMVAAAFSGPAGRFSRAAV